MSAVLSALQNAAGAQGGEGSGANMVNALLPVLSLMMKANQQKPAEQPATPDDPTGERMPSEERDIAVKYPKKAHGLTPLAGLADKQMIYLLNKYFSYSEG